MARKGQHLIGRKIVPIRLTHPVTKGLPIRLGKLSPRRWSHQGLGGIGDIGPHVLLEHEGRVGRRRRLNDAGGPAKQVIAGQPNHETEETRDNGF